jgi:hypothetical protein
MSYYAGFSALGLGSEHMDSELITIIESPENPVQIGYATPMGMVPDHGLQPYILCLFGDRRPVAGDWFLKDGRFWPADQLSDLRQNCDPEETDTLPHHGEMAMDRKSRAGGAEEI